MHFFFTTDIVSYTFVVDDTAQEYRHCTYRDEYEDFVLGPWYWISGSLADFIPFGLVFAGNCAIVAKMIANSVASKRLRAVAASDDDSRKVTTYSHAAHSSSLPSSL